MSIHVLSIKNEQYEYPFARYLQTKQLFFQKKNKWQKVKVIGVVGSCGKTTTALYLYYFLKAHEHDVCYIGTHKILYKNTCIQTNNTTPEANLLLQTLKDYGIFPKWIVMEVSSHAINEGRINFLRFSVLIFTNLGRDHLDYHCNMKNYFQVKQAVFLSSSPFCLKIINTDDVAGKKIAHRCHFKKTIGEKQFFLLREIETLHFNYYNLLCAYWALRHLHYHHKTIITGLKAIHPENGRAEMIRIGKYRFVIDYAHTPEAYEAILADDVQNKIVVFGCGGNRDSQKRSEIGRIVDQYAKLSIVTEDNSRFEDLQIIKEEIVSKMKHYHYIPNREEAIRYAILHAAEGDTIYILGKGDETVIEKEGKKILFNDKAFIYSYFQHHEQ